MGLFKKYFGDRYRKHCYAQCGEDLIVDYLRKRLGLKAFTYLDVGAFHPSRFSNTFLFYLKGFSGVCIEPDPQLCRAIAAKRGRDKVLNVGIGLSSEPFADFYVMSAGTLSTFSREEAERYAGCEGKKIEQIIKIPLLNINEVIAKNFDGCPNFVSIDVEGLDYDIVNSFSFDKYRPEIFCVESMTYSEDKNETKVNEILEHMEKHGYLVYADTFINTIFVDKAAWGRREA